MAKSFTKYKPEFCDLLIQFGERGESVVAFCAEIGISPNKFYRWREKYPNFDNAAEVSKTKACAFWEKLGVNIMLNEPLVSGSKKTGDRVVWMFFMKNRFKEFGYQNDLPQASGAEGFDV